MEMTRRELLTSGGVATLSLGLMPSIAGAEQHWPRRREGFANVPGGRIWYRSVGDGRSAPLLLFHGGPGAGHDYLETLEALATERQVIFYDQLGCGRSDRPDDPALWEVGRFVDEIDALRTQLGLGRIILYGHSWGGWLAQEYMRTSRHAASVEGLILASTSASAREFVVGAERLLAAMPGGADKRRRRLEAEGRMNSAEYKAIVERFYDRHLVHVDHAPVRLKRTLNNIAESRPYAVMNGPNEFSVTGTLKEWDARASLGAIGIPTLVVAGEWDEMTIECQQALHRGIRDSTLAILPGTRHLAMIERPQHYNHVLGRFLSRLS